MKACMVAYTFYETDNRVRRYAEALVKRGDQVDAVALQRDGQPRFEVIRGVRVYRIQRRRIDEQGPLSYLWKLLLFFFRSAWFLTKRSCTVRYDLIHVHSVPDFEIFAAIIPKIVGSRIILDIHDIVPEFYASKFGVTEQSVIFRALLRLEKASTRFADHVIISNQIWQAKLIDRSVSSRKCSTVINYPDPSIFYPRFSERTHDGEFWMCYPGTLNRHQGLDVAVRAVRLLTNSIPGIKLFIIGDGPDRDLLKAMVEHAKLQDHVILRGFVPLEEVAEILTNMDLGVVPKRKNSFGNEAFSTKILEFMAMGVPVVAAKTSIDELYFHERLIKFFESENAHDLAAKILELYENPKQRLALSTAGARFISHNNWEIKKAEYLVLVDTLVRNPVQFTGKTAITSTN
jgi:glycosyltransferase involved in cell wall biosynthesis